MNKRRGRGLLIVIAILIAIVVGLTYLLVKMWIVPAAKQSELVNEIKGVSSDKVSELVDAYNTETNAEEEPNEIVVPEVTNDLIDNTSWVNYNDNTLIAFKDGYFVWYSDDSMSSDNCILGQFELYTGEDAFNLLSNTIDDEIEQSDTDSVLIMQILSKKVDGEETLGSPTNMYMFGYYTESIMSYIDLASYEEYVFLRVDSSSVEESVEPTIEPEATEIVDEN